MIVQYTDSDSSSEDDENKNNICGNFQIANTSINPAPIINETNHKSKLISPSEAYHLELTETENNKQSLPISDFWNTSSTTSMKRKPVKRSNIISPSVSSLENILKNNKMKKLSTVTNEEPCFFIHSRVLPLIGNTYTERLPSFKQLNIKAHEDSCNKLLWNNRCDYSHLLASCSMDSTIKIWNMLGANAIELRCLKQHSKAVRDIEWSMSNKSILSCSFDKTVCEHDIETANQLSIFHMDSYPYSINYLDLNTFLVGTKDKMLLFDNRLENAVRKFTYKTSLGNIQSICHSNELIYTANDLVCRDSCDRNIMAWDLKSCAVLSNEIYKERFTCVRLKLSEEKHLLFAQSNANHIATFDLKPPFKRRKYIYNKHEISGYNIGFDIGYQRIYTGSNNGYFYIYDFQSGYIIKKLNLGENNICMDICRHPIISGLIAGCTGSGRILTWQ